MQNTAFNAAAILLSLTAFTAQAADVHVVDFGAIPNDGQCDRAAIQSAITAASIGLPRICRFDAGVYNLNESNAVHNKHLNIDDAHNLTLIGATNALGEPVTILERNVAQMQNNLASADLISITDSYNITIQNLVTDNKPAFATAGEVVLVDEPNDAIEVDVFADLPHYDGMASFSANVWDLTTRTLRPVGPLSIGVNEDKFETWQHVAGGDGRRYRIAGMGMAEKVHVGDGASWHFTVSTQGGTFNCERVNGLTLENIRILNSAMGVFWILRCSDITLRRVVVAPEPPQLAVASRDSFLAVENYGQWLMEDCYIKGVRWDPINLGTKYFKIEEVLDARTVRAAVKTGSSPSDTSNPPMANTDATLRILPRPVVATIASDVWDSTASEDDDGNRVVRVTVTFADDLPPQVVPGTGFMPHVKMSNPVIIRNTTFESNYGRPLYFLGHELLVEGCTFRNNAYSCIFLGSEGGDGFVRNAVIRGNTFADSTWDMTNGGPTTGAIRVFSRNASPEQNTPYNDNILIEDNTFVGINHNPDYAAIDLRTVQNVTVRCNTYTDTPNRVQIDPDSTAAITIENDGLPDGCQVLDTVAADFNDMNLGEMRSTNQPAGTGSGFLEDYWSAGTAWVRVVSGDLTAPVATGYGVVQTGAAQRVQGQYPSGDRRQARALVPVNGAGGEAIWISFLAQNMEATDVAGIDLMTSSSTNVNPPAPLRKIILEGTTLKIVSSGAGGGDVDVSNRYTLGETALVLAKLTTNDANQPEQINVWINPNVTAGAAGLGAPDFDQSGDLAWDMDSITWVGLQSWDTGPDGVGGYIDNLRISNGVAGFQFVVQPILPDDCDRNNAVDWADYLEFEQCITGPDHGASSECTCTDFDFDASVDLRDLSMMQRQFTGSI